MSLAPGAKAQMIFQNNRQETLAQAEWQARISPQSACYTKTEAQRHHPILSSPTSHTQAV